MHGGHIFTNTTIAAACGPFLTCNADATSTDDSFFLKLENMQTLANWQDEAMFEHSTPPLRRASGVILEPFIYLTGGMGWSGWNGVGELNNLYTWAIELKDTYFNN